MNGLSDARGSFPGRFRDAVWAPHRNQRQRLSKNIGSQSVIQTSGLVSACPGGRNCGSSARTRLTLRTERLRGDVNQGNLTPRRLLSVEQSGAFGFSLKICFAVWCNSIVAPLHTFYHPFINKFGKTTIDFISGFVDVDSDYRGRQYNTCLRQQLKDSVVNGQLHPPRWLTCGSHFLPYSTPGNLSGSNNEYVWLTTWIDVKIYYSVSLIHVIQIDATLRRVSLPGDTPQKLAGCDTVSLPRVSRRSDLRPMEDNDARPFQGSHRHAVSTDDHPVLTEIHS